MGEASTAAETLITYWPLALPAAVLLTLLCVLIVSVRRRRKTKGSHADPLPLAEFETMSRDKGHSRDDRSAPDGESAALVEACAVPSAAAQDATAHEPRSKAALSAAAHPPVSLEQQPLRKPQPVQAQAQAQAQAKAHAHVPSKNQERETSAPPPVADIGAIADRIAEAEAHEGRKGDLAGLYLQLAQAYLADQRPDAALGALRSAAGCGAMHGPADAHAEARLVLGELALAAGDRIGACEQWQIAKTVFHDHGMRDAYGKVDAKMRANGCPTDWVLTEF